LLTELASDKGKLTHIHETLKKQYQNESSWDDDFDNLKKEIDAFFSH
jgi:hypothetical protein